jgi:hypothetical protein
MIKLIKNRNFQEKVILKNRVKNTRNSKIFKINNKWMKIITTKNW